MPKIEAGPSADIAPGESTIVEAGEREIAVFNVDGTFYAIENTCCHRGGPLGEGELEGAVVTCPWHGWEFDVTTGRCHAPMPDKEVASFPVHEENGALFVEVP